MHLRPLVPAVRDSQRVARVERASGGARTRVLTDSAPPLQLQLGQIALPLAAGEEIRVDAAKRQVDDRGEVGVVTALVFLDGFIRKWVRQNPAEPPRQAGPGIGERLQHRSEFS